MKLFMLQAFACVLLMCSQAILAADLYRCGNSYQDTPCLGAVSNKPISKNTASKNTVQANNNALASENQAPITVDVDCKQRGDAAKKIMWMREVGKTAEDQIEAAQDSYTQALIKDVYSHRGSSLQVRNAIEHECMQQKEKDRLAEKLMIEAERLRAGGSAAAEGAVNNKAKSRSIPVAQKDDAMENSQNHNDKQDQCNDLKSSLDNIASKRRKGGSASYMEDLRQRQYQLESDLKSSGC